MMRARAMVWNLRLNPATAGETSESMPQRVGVQGVHGENVPVRGFARGRRGTAEVLAPEVVAHRERARRQPRTVAAASPARQLGDRCRDAEDQPVPEAGSGR